MNGLYSQSITSYCERLGTGLFSEPLNFFSNIVFFIVGFLMLREVSSRKLDTSYKILVLLTLLIGTGSFLWHSVRNTFSHAMDFLPIFAFILVYLYLVLQKLFSNKLYSYLGIVFFFFIQVYLSSSFPNLLNGSIRHVFTITVLIVTMAYLYSINKLGRNFLLMLFSYITAVIFRSIDNLVCPVISSGTHFLWHILTAFTVYFAFKAFLVLDKEQLPTGRK